MKGVIDIAVPTHNNLTTFRPCMEAIFTNTIGVYRLTVIDDSTDGETPQYLEKIGKDHPNLKVVHPPFTVTKGNQLVQLALDNTESEYMVYMADSTRVEPEWLQYSIQVMDENPTCAMVAFKVLFPNGLIEQAGMLANKQGLFDIGKYLPGHRLTYINEVQMTGHCLVLLRRKAMEGALDVVSYTGFRGFEDPDACLTVRQNGWKILYCGFGSGYHDREATRMKNRPPNYEAEVQRDFKVFMEKWKEVLQ